MRTTLKNHEDIILAASGVLFGVLVLGCVVWSVLAVSRGLGTAVDSPDAARVQVQYDIKGARELNFRGLE